MNKRLAAEIILGVVLGLMLALCVALAHGLPTQVQPKEGVVIDLQADTVLHGNLVDEKILGDERAAFTNIRIVPWNKPLLYDFSVLLCGYQGEELQVQNPVEIEFEVQSHRMYEGIGCHRLVKVQHWTPPVTKGW
ncbi:MAG: hypothetical protein C5B59_06750 [Bacteroidetes bacterium]|nr:MAG: hypothetical protein C5B59_06750 [Bacteroidota bacterium]